MRMEVNLIRIDNSGVFALPEGYTVNDVKAILLDGVTINDFEYTITENGNIDITMTKEFSTATAVVEK